MTTPPREYADLILIPAILHTPTTDFWALPWPLQEKIRRLLNRYIAAGWGGNPAMIKRDSHAEL